MNNLQMNWFLEEIKKNKGYHTEIQKDDIVNFAEELGLEVKKSTAKSKIIDNIISLGFGEKLYDTFQEFLYVPEWTVRELFNLSKEKFNSLVELGVITTTPIIKEFSGRGGVFNASAYPLSVLEDYTEEQLKEAYNTAYKKNVFRMRIETKTKEEVVDIIELLLHNFEITESPQSYEHNDGSGFYNYFSIRPIPKDELGQKSIAIKNEKLRKEVDELRDENIKLKQELFELKRIL